MIRNHGLHAFMPWFAWYRVPVSDTQTAWLCWVERTVFWNESTAFFTYRLPPKDIAGYVTNVTPVETPFMAAMRDQTKV